MGEPETIIRVENLGKRYVIDHQRERAHYTTLRDRLAEGARALTRRIRHPFRSNGRHAREEFWALQDINFEVRRGEIVGIIGRNGAGKSTLLKVLSRITEPTTGRVTLDGRVGSLLEVGTGFHPELTGRENIFLNGAILGMGRSEVRRKFDDIVTFAEVEAFLDTPVKRYSSGMYVRLAFAVAAHLEPEILVVDEVLAVGDAMFQKKCLGRMSEAARSGRTVLFVSHNLSAVAGLCRRGLLLERGRTRADGRVEEVLAAYAHEAATAVFEAAVRSDGPCIHRVELDQAALHRGDFRLSVHFTSPVAFEPVVGVVLSSSQGAPLFGTNPTVHGEGYTPAVLESGVAAVTVPDLPLHSGTYRASVWLSDRHGTVHDSKSDALLFEFVAPEMLPNGLSPDVIGPLRTTAMWKLVATRPRESAPGRVDVMGSALG